MNCLDCKENISSYIEEDLTKDAISDFEAHLSECRECMEEYEVVKKMLLTLSDLEVELPESFAKELQEKLIVESETIKRKRKLTQSVKRSIKLVSGIAATLAVGFITISILSTNTSKSEKMATESMNSSTDRKMSSAQIMAKEKVAPDLSETAKSSEQSVTNSGALSDRAIINDKAITNNNIFTAQDQFGSSTSLNVDKASMDGSSASQKENKEVIVGNSSENKKEASTIITSKSADVNITALAPTPTNKILTMTVTDLQLAKDKIKLKATQLGATIKEGADSETTANSTASIVVEMNTNNQKEFVAYVEELFGNHEKTPNTLISTITSFTYKKEATPTPTPSYTISIIIKER